MKTEGDSRRKLSERKDPGASVGCYIEQGFPADAIQYRLRGLANGRPAETPLDEALASASIPQFRWPGHPHASRGGQGPIQGRPSRSALMDPRLARVMRARAAQPPGA